MVFILATFIAAFPLLVSNNYYRSVMVFVGIHAMVAIGLALLLVYAGQISLGHGAFLASELIPRAFYLLSLE
jgi:branched-chain amino acid transport system permease protein